jgi:photosystem II stability/assembly factor-like uncharacterized protein
MSDRRLLKSFLVAVVFTAFLFSGCGKFDRSRIKMPEIKMVTPENLHSISCVDPDHIWASGNYGTILFSADSGRTWQQQESGIDEYLLGSIVFTDINNGWAAGINGTIIHTADGGKTWAAQKSNTNSNLLDLFFIDADYGWAVGELGTVIHTADGGKTWVSQGEEQDAILNDVFFADRKIGWIVGEFGTIMHTNDSGRTWLPQYCKDIEPEVSETEWEIPMPALYGLYFINRSVGWIVGMDGVILKTADGGKNWKKVNSDTDKPLYSIVVKGNKGVAVGCKGVYLDSEDAGQTWKQKKEALKTKFWLREISFTENIGVIVGARGTVAITDTGGASWELISGFSYDMDEFGLSDF